MNTFKNSNGYEYELLKQSGNYSIVRRLSDSEITVAWGLRGDDFGKITDVNIGKAEGTFSWGQGAYFGNDVKGAIRYFKSKTGRV